mmetsp:Transcript_28541/g.94700  ORF Transcript_28541/g.94700 Transcript_28541/m.94700 type:complete len:221 (+) Transcript_28541:95-757(+)
MPCSAALRRASATSKAGPQATTPQPPGEAAASLLGVDPEAAKQSSSKSAGRSGRPAWIVARAATTVGEAFAHQGKAAANRTNSGASSVACLDMSQEPCLLHSGSGSDRLEACDRVSSSVKDTWRSTERALASSRTGMLTSRGMSEASASVLGPAASSGTGSRRSSPTPADQDGEGSRSRMDCRVTKMRTEPKAALETNSGSRAANHATASGVRTTQMSST